MNYKEIINDANGVLNSNEATNINIIEWVKTARSLAYSALGVEPDEYLRISTKKLGNGIWVAYDIQSTCSCLATDEQSAMVEVAGMIRMYGNNTTTAPSLTGRCEEPDWCEEHRRVSHYSGIWDCSSENIMSQVSV